VPESYRSPGAFTLLELLIVIVLLISIGAIITPFTIGGMDRSAFDDAQRHYEGAVMMARAEAQRRGVVLELVARSDSGGSTLCTREVEQQSRGEQGADGGAEQSRASVGVGENELLAFSAGISVSDVDPTLKTEPDQGQQDPAMPDGTGSNVSGTGPASSPSGEIVLGLFFPDGQIEPAAPRFLVGAADRVARMEINRWTGAVVASVVVHDPKSDGESEKQPEGPARSDAAGTSGPPKDSAESGDKR
jgi:type II secretory pathway pseudopilin PulG